MKEAALLYHFAPGEPPTRESFMARVHPEDRLKVDETIERARNSTDSFESEYRLLLPNGETRWHIARGRYLRDDRGKLSELMGVAIDVTAQIRANLDLRLQREEMARLSRVALMGELTASLAHELNQPLTAIASNAAAGKRFLARGSPDLKMFEELLDDIFTDARRAGEVIHGIHRFVRKGDDERHAVDLNEVIREVLRLLHSDLLGRSTTVETDLAPEPGRGFGRSGSSPAGVAEPDHELARGDAAHARPRSSHSDFHRGRTMGLSRSVCAITGAVFRRETRKKFSPISFPPNRTAWEWV